MLLIKVVLALFLYLKYCDAKNILRHKDGEVSVNQAEYQTTATTTELTLPPAKDVVTENSDCPANKSLYSKKDIKVIINYVFNELRLNDTVIEEAIGEIIYIDVTSHDLNQFESWLKSQPEHLIHVLQGLSAVRKKQIEPEAQKIAVILKEYPQVKESIDEKQVKYNKSMKILNKYENLCKYNCEDQELEPNRIFKRSILDRSIQDVYLCTTITELYENITTEFKENFGKFMDKMKNKFHIVNKQFVEDIKKYKIDLKERALEVYGRTMYDVLKLEDEYQHFAKEMNATNTENLMFNVKDVGLKIDSKLLELQRLIEEYGQYCRNCNKGPVKRHVRHTKLQINVHKKYNDSILNELIQEKYNEIETEINPTFEGVVKDLNKTIHDSKRKETLIKNLTLNQKEIEEDLNNEKQSLEYLKSIASQATLKKLSDLSSLSEVLSNNIDEKIKYLKHKIH